MFVVHLPAARETDAAAMRSRAEPAPSLAPPSRRLRVLFIDDEELYARSMCTLASIQPTIVPRIVFLTGGATNERARAFLERSDIRCLDKPVPLDILKTTIREVTREGLRSLGQSVSSAPISKRAPRGLGSPS